MLNLAKIDYSHALADEARAMRQHQAYGGKNIATFCLTNKKKVTMASIPAGPPGVTPKHSERAAWDALVASGELKGVIYLDTEIPYGRLQLGVPQEQLHCTQVLGAPIDQRRLGPAHRMRPVVCAV